MRRDAGLCVGACVCVQPMLRQHWRKTWGGRFAHRPVMRRKRVRMTSRENPPTDAVTTTRTWPWSAISGSESENHSGAKSQHKKWFKMIKLLFWSPNKYIWIINIATKKQWMMAHCLSSRLLFWQPGWSCAMFCRRKSSKWAVWVTVNCVCVLLPSVVFSVTLFV